MCSYNTARWAHHWEAVGGQILRWHLISTGFHTLWRLKIRQKSQEKKCPRDIRLTATQRPVRRWYGFCYKSKWKAEVTLLRFKMWHGHRSLFINLTDNAPDLWTLRLLINFKFSRFTFVLMTLKQTKAIFQETTGLSYKPTRSRIYRYLLTSYPSYRAKQVLYSIILTHGLRPEVSAPISTVRGVSVGYIKV